MAILTFYDPITLEQDAGGELGVLNLDHEFVPVMGRNGLINPDFHRYLTRLGVDSLQVTCRSGLARFRKENRPDNDGNPRFYWYAYKKVKGKLNKSYIGTASQMTEQVIEDVVAKVNVSKVQVTQSDCVTTQTPAIAPVPPVELAGHGKSDRYLQSSLNLQTDYEILKTEISSRDETIKSLVSQGKKQAAKIKELEYLLDNEVKHSAKVERDYKDLLETVENQANDDLTHTVQMQANLIKSLRNDLETLERQSSMYQELSDKNFNYLSVIEKYRKMAHGKTKKDNPRFAYLIDFLTDIDKLC